MQGQDTCSLAAMDAWISEATKQGASEEIIEAAIKQRNVMADWAEHVTCKVPDLPDPE